VDTLGMIDFFRAYPLGSPFMEQESQRNLELTPKKQQITRYIRRYADINPVFKQVLLSESFGVAPKAWPKVIEESFPVNEPPSPYEMACAFLKAPAPRHWGFLSSYEDRHLVSGFMWYLAGAPPPAIAEALQCSVQTLYNRFSRLISWAGNASKFVIWAVSTDLMPIVTNQRRARALAALYRGDGLSRWLGDARNSFRIYDEIVKTPYMQAQLKAKAAFAPIPRPIYTPGLVFPSIQAKREWESTDSLPTRWLMRFRYRFMELNPDEKLPWAKLPLRVPVYDRDDPEVKNELRRRARKRRQRARSASSG